MFAYYTTMRPPMPGCVPGKGLIEVENFNERCHIPNLNIRAWGIAYYDRELTEKEIDEYELEEVNFKWRTRTCATKKSFTKQQS